MAALDLMVSRDLLESQAPPDRRVRQETRGQTATRERLAALVCLVPLEQGERGGHPGPSDPPDSRETGDFPAPEETLAPAEPPDPRALMVWTGARDPGERAGARERVAEWAPQAPPEEWERLGLLARTDLTDFLDLRVPVETTAVPVRWVSPDPLDLWAPLVPSAPMESVAQLENREIKEAKDPEGNPEPSACPERGEPEALPELRESLAPQERTEPPEAKASWATPELRAPPVNLEWMGRPASLESLDLVAALDILESVDVRAPEAREAPLEFLDSPAAWDPKVGMGPGAPLVPQARSERLDPWDPMACLERGARLACLERREPLGRLVPPALTAARVALDAPVLVVPWERLAPPARTPRREHLEMLETWAPPAPQAAPAPGERQEDLARLDTPDLLEPPARLAPRERLELQESRESLARLEVRASPAGKAELERRESTAARAPRETKVSPEPPASPALTAAPGPLDPLDPRVTPALLDLQALREPRDHTEILAAPAVTELTVPQACPACRGRGGLVGRTDFLAPRAQ